MLHPHALLCLATLVGAADHLTLDADLKGPANDARLMADTLVLGGVDPARITVLSSDPSGLPRAQFVSRE